MNRPFTFITMFFILGIILSRIWLINLPMGLILIIFAALLLFMELFQKASPVWLALLLILFGFFIHQNQFPITTKLGGYGEDLTLMEVVVLRESILKYNNTDVEVKIVKLRGENKSIEFNEKAKLIIRGTTSLGLKPGEHLKIKDVKLTKEFNSRNLEGYDLYLRGKGIQYQLSVDGEQVERIPQGRILPFLALRYETKNYTENFFTKTLQQPQQEIMKSVLFGNQGYLSAEVRRAFSRSGTAHIVAVSGLHIGIIVLMLERLLRALGIGRNKSLGMICLGILFYGFIVGFPVSIIRAGTMYYLYVLAYFLNRRYDSINCLMFIAFITLLFNPLNLFSVAFQLSFSATLSILILYPIFKEIPLGMADFLKNLLAVTLAAQLGTMPIIAFHFQEVSIISLMVNLLIVPTLGLLLSLGFISVMVSLIFYEFGALISYFNNGLLTYIYWVVEKSSDLPYGSLQIQRVNGFGIIFYYIVLVLICYLLTSGKHLWYRESWRKDELSENSK